MHANRIRRARVIARLIDSWCIPVFIGIALGTGLSVWQLGEVAQMIGQQFSDALDLVVQSCGVTE
ncbi:hypothetical protein [Pseudomonas sp. AG1028]|uniref:hypothetical protein n=1 Tax=Pseudomonas sp. AG1028 TaxID=2572911 RepID=UPI0011BFD888|nr:hypothetical protein [Pseudomonas sp. AG1028]